MTGFALDLALFGAMATLTTLTTDNQRSIIPIQSTTGHVSLVEQHLRADAAFRTDGGPRTSKS